MAKGMTKKIICLLCVLLVVPLFTISGFAAEEPSLITDYATLMTAVRDAKDGDVLLVGDIDFRPTSPSVPYSSIFIRTETDITIKSGKADGTAAVFQNAGFVIAGSKTSGEKTTCRFENIVFDGCADTASLTAADFEYPWSEVEQAPTYYAPMKAQQAIACEGNVDASFSWCVFRNYMHEFGPVLDLRYGDYTGNEYINLPDYSSCTANISFDGCRIENNAAFYDGGAIYIDGNNNVTLNMTDTVISSNRSGAGQHRGGAGAIKAERATVNMVGCTISNNTGNHIYEGLALADSDGTRGGALQMMNGALSMVNCTLTGNRASLGGALSLTNMKADIDGCRFTENRAEANDNKTYTTTGPWSNMSLGGAIYIEGTNNGTVTLVNCDISDNSAATAYGGIYGFYTLLSSPSDPAYHLKLILCTYKNNKVDATYTYPVEEKWLWFSHPGDMTKNIHLSMFGCYMVDDTFVADFPHSDSPTAENGYNYISGAEDAAVLASAIPADAVLSLLGDRYGDKLTEYHVGSNYAESLYKEEEETDPPSMETDPPSTETDPPSTGTTPPDTEPSSPLSWIIWVAAFIVVGGAIFAALMWRKKTNVTSTTDEAETIESKPETATAPAAVPENPTVIKIRYDDDEIDRFIALVPEAGTLTTRELEVLREILRGKKQSEVAFYLGIGVTTVKDFYKKIYAKLNVEKKDEIFLIASKVLKK